MKKTIIILSLISMVWVSCFRNPNKPGLVYMPDMMYPIAVETYDETKNKDIYTNDMSALVPAKGTIPFAQGPIYNNSEYKPYRHPKSAEGEEASKADLNPIEKTEANLAEGKRLYAIYCSPCHGETGNADGSVTAANDRAFPMGPIFSYYADANINMSEGQMFYITQHGRNMMQSYATQLNVKERWMIVAYVKQMQEQYKKDNNMAAPAKTDAASK